MAAPLSVLRAGGSEVAVGWLLALFSCASVLLALPAGRLADRRGYRYPVRLAVALTTLGALTALGSTFVGRAQYVGLCLSAVLSGSGANIGMITIQRSAGKSAHDSTELKRIFSWLGIAPSFSNFLGPLGAGLLIDHFGFAAAFALLASLPLLSLLCARLVPDERPVAVAPSARRAAAWDLLRLPLVRRVLAVNWFMSASWDVHSFVVPVLGNQRGLRASAIGSILGIFALAVTAVRLVIPVLAHRLSESQVLSGAMIIVASVFAIYPLASSVWTMAACAAVLGLALGSSQPMVMTRLHQITPAHRHGEAIALRSMALNFSSAVMPMCFGALGTALGASGLFWVMGALVAGGAWVARSLR
jgi:predicted MFS family arabinose efflux permease